MDATGKGTLTYTTSGETEEGFFAEVRRVQPNGKVRTLADLVAYEEANNPDAGSSYGFHDLTPDCAAQVPDFIGGEPYTGIIESHPYAVALMPDGSRVIADAAANDLIRVADNGAISTLAVLPPQPFVVTAGSHGYRSAGVCDRQLYIAEPVPTDVELARTGCSTSRCCPVLRTRSRCARGCLHRGPGDG